MNKQVEELVECVEKEITQWLIQNYPAGKELLSDLVKRILSRPDLYQRVEHQGGHYLNGTWQPSVRVEYIPLAEALKEGVE